MSAFEILMEELGATNMAHVEEKPVTDEQHLCLL